MSPTLQRQIPPRSGIIPLESPHGWLPVDPLSRPPRRGRPVEHSAHNRHRFYCVICSAGSRGKEGKDLSRGKEGKDLTHEYFQLRECQVADRYVDITRGTCLCS